MTRPDEPVTELLAALEAGDKSAFDKLLPLVYDRLRAMANKQMRGERADHTLNATALVHEAFVKLKGQDRAGWKNRGHFLSVAAMAMRRILINHAEAKRAEKRGGGQALATFDEAIVGSSMSADELVALDVALERLKAMSERQAKVVELCFFGGLTHEEVAELLAISVPTVRRDWRLARAWLSKELGP